LFNFAGVHVGAVAAAAEAAQPQPSAIGTRDDAAAARLLLNTATYASVTVGLVALAG
jgi:hypothetical protein